MRRAIIVTTLTLGILVGGATVLTMGCGITFSKDDRGRLDKGQEVMSDVSGHLSALVDAVKDLKTQIADLNTQLGNVKELNAGIGRLEAEIRGLSTKLERVGHLDKSTQELTARIADLQKELSELKKLFIPGAGG